MKGGIGVWGGWILLGRDGVRGKSMGGWVGGRR